jgi:hypothetical protein
MASAKERLKLLNRAEHAPRLRDNITDQTTNGAVLKYDSATGKWYAGTDGQGAPSDAQYVVVQSGTGLPNERVLTNGNGISFTDGGAGQGVSADLFISGQATGDLLLRGPTDWVRVPQGSMGQLFTITDAGVGWENQSYGFPKNISEGAIVVQGDGVLCVCSFRFDPGTYPGISSFRFQAVLSCVKDENQGSASARARLYNPDAGVYIANATISTSNLSPTTLTSSAISVTTSGPNADDGFIDTGGVYEVHVDVSNAQNNSMDTAVLGYAGIVR